MVNPHLILALTLALTLGTSAGVNAERSDEATATTLKRGLLDEGDRERWQHHPDWAKAWSFNRKLYRATKPRTIAYGSTARPSMLIGEINPPFVTPERDQVEVMPFQMYGARGWAINQPVEHKWLRTLPDEVRVRYAPAKSLFQAYPIHEEQRRRAIRQNLYLTAIEMGVPATKAHGLIVRAIGRSLTALETERTHRNYAKLLKLDPDEFQAMRTSAAVRWRETEAEMLERGQSETMFSVGERLDLRARGQYISRMYPDFLIDGRYVVTMTNTMVVQDTYWMANWAIKRSLKDLDENRHWPRSAAELADWLAPYDGQILSRWYNGRWHDDDGFPPGIVYDASEQTIWMLGGGGSIEHFATLTETDHGTHFVYTDHEGRQSYFDPWRVTRQLKAWIPADGSGVALRHPILEFPDQLARHATPVTLGHGENRWTVRFETGNQATIETAERTITGTWRMDGNQVAIIADNTTRAFEWPYVAWRADLEPRPEVTQPWNYPKQFEAPDVDQVARSGAAEPSTTAKAEAADEVTASMEAAIEQLRQKVRAALRGEHERGN